jgi:hypothetical protein
MLKVSEWHPFLNGLQRRCTISRCLALPQSSGLSLVPVHIQQTRLEISVGPIILLLEATCEEKASLENSIQFREDNSFMKKPSVKKLLLLVGILALMLAAFTAGGIALSSAHAASTHTQSGCSSKCKADLKSSSNQAKVIATVNTVAGDKIQATIQEPLDKKGSMVTIVTTSKTLYQPDPSVVVAGKTIFAAGTLNNDGSITADVVGSYDPTVGAFGGTITSIDGSTITVQTKDKTATILVTTSTTFLRGDPKTKATQPASQSDLKVGETIEAQGKLNSDGSLTATSVTILVTFTNLEAIQ